MIEVSSWNMKFVAECLKFLGPFGGGSWQPAAEGEDEEMAQLLGQMGGGAGGLPPGVVQVRMHLLCCLRCVAALHANQHC
jgi:hypothetical protein